MEKTTRTTLRTEFYEDDKLVRVEEKIEETMETNEAPKYPYQIYPSYPLRETWTSGFHQFASPDTQE